MAAHNEFGEKGEELAVRWLTRNGFTILQRNWRKGRYEIDIIAQQKEVLHFVEVKTRSSTFFGFPEENIGYKKIRSIMKAGAAFLYQYPAQEKISPGSERAYSGWKRVQYDVMAITAKGDEDYDYFFIEDISL